MFSKKTLIATKTIKINWTDLKQQELITFYLFVDKKGKRFYKVYEYGYCKIYKIHVKYLGSILNWVYGGEIPTNLNWKDKTNEKTKK